MTDDKANSNSKTKSQKISLSRWRHKKDASTFTGGSSDNGDATAGRYTLPAADNTVSNGTEEQELMVKLSGPVNGDPKTEDETKKRETWASGTEFLLSTMGYAIGLGNVWRFPYVCYENGGGAFLIPYFVMLLLVCFPLMFLEMGLGQFSSLGCISVWRVSPFFKGIGYAMAMVSSYFCFYYVIIISYSIFYMFASMASELPWRGCNHTWNTPACFEGSVNRSEPEVVLTTLWTNGTLDPNVTAVPAVERVWATEEYWKYYVLDQTDGLHDMGTIRWQLLLCFIATWLIVYLCIIRGVKTSGKVVYFTATFPFLVLFILLIRGVTLEGAVDGILYFIRPRFDKLGEAKVWLAAANQVFLSYGAGWGGILTLASYNRFDRHCIRDALIIIASGSFTSVLSGFVIFSVLGFMAHDAGVDVKDVVSSGPGLAFVAYPEALSRMPIPQLWAFLFFFMLLTLGLDSEFVTLETCITAIVDEFKDDYPILHRHRFLVIIGTCLVMFLIGLPLTMQGGVYVFELFNWYSAGFTPMLIVIFEVIAVCYVYGGKRFMVDVSFMFGDVPFQYWWFFCWYLLAPFSISVIMIFGFAQQVPAYYGDYVFPAWAQAIGWCLTMSSIVFILIYCLYSLGKQKSGSIRERFRSAVKPDPMWGPALEEDRRRANYPPLEAPPKYEMKEVEPCV